MSVRVPNNLFNEPDEIGIKTPNRAGKVQRIVYVIGGKMHEVWELLSSTFLDKLGNPFYGKDGMPFQGKQE